MRFVHFFSDDASTEPEEPQEWRAPEWMAPPDDELPSVFPLAMILARNERVVLSLLIAEVFSTGVRLPVTVVQRRTTETIREWNESVNFQGSYSGGAEDLRFGIQFADGGRAVPPRTWRADMMTVPPEAPALTVNGGGGGGGPTRNETTQQLWLWPLPPAQSFELVLEWRDRGIGETRVTLDGAALAAAASGVQQLWAE